VDGCFISRIANLLLFLNGKLGMHREKAICDGTSFLPNVEVIEANLLLTKSLKIPLSSLLSMPFHVGIRNCCDHAVFKTSNSCLKALASPLCSNL